MKKLIKTLFGITLLSIPLFANFSCAIFGYTEIENADQFMAMKEGGSYKLVNDINLAGKTIDPVKVANFDGDGHRVFGAIVGSKRMYNSYNSSENMISSFFYEADSIKNVTFDKISLTSTNVESSSIVGYKCKNYENVTVKNSSIVATFEKNASLVLGSTFSGLGVGAIEGMVAKSIVNCHIEKTKITLNNSGYYGSNVGGIVGETVGNQVFKTLSNCSAKDITITVNSSNADANVGGIAGWVYTYGKNEVIENLRVEGAEIKVKGDETIQMGGVIGFATVSNNITPNYKINYLVTKDSVIAGECNTSDGRLRTGGSIGYASDSNEVSDVLVQNTEISQCGTAKNGCSGGVVGKSEKTLKRLVSNNNQVSSLNSYAGGLLGGGSVAVNNSFVNGFSSSCNLYSGDETTMMNNCYYKDSNCEQMEDATELGDNESIITKIGLDSSKWSLKDGLFDIEF